MTILFDLKTIWSKEINYAIIFPLLIMTLIYFNFSVLVKEKRYKKISDYFEKKKSQDFAKSLALFLIFFLFGFFIFSGISLGRYLNPW